MALPWAHSVVFHEECDSTAVCLKQPGEAGKPWRNGGKTCCRLEAGQKTRGVGSSLPSPSGPLSILLLLPPLLTHPPPFCSSAPPHPLFMSAWIAPFHYIQLPAHYQSHRRFNNRSPTSPLPFRVLLFPWRPTMRIARKGESERRREPARAVVWGGKREWEAGSVARWPLVFICEDGNLWLQESEVKLSSQRHTTSSTAYRARAKKSALFGEVCIKNSSVPGK